MALLGSRVIGAAGPASVRRDKMETKILERNSFAGMYIRTAPRCPRDTIILTNLEVPK